MKSSLPISIKLKRTNRHKNPRNNLLNRRNNCHVITSIPPYYNFLQRKTLYDTLKLGSWNPLGFISENVAASIYYGREYSDETKKKTVLLYNLGSTSLEISII